MTIGFKGAKRTAWYSIHDSQSGFAMVTVLFLVSMLAVIGITLNRTGGLQSTISFNLNMGEEAFYIANAGIQHGLFKLRRTPGLRGTIFSDVAFGSGSYNVSIVDENPAKGVILVTSAGKTGTALRTIERRIYPDPSVTVYPQLIKDTYLSQEKLNWNFGVSGQINIGCWKVQPDRALFEYDLSIIPAGAAIDSAVFELYMFGRQRDVINSNEIKIRVHWMARSWNEGINNNEACTNGATWPTSDCATSWTVGGGDHEPNYVTEKRLYYDAPNQWYQWDVKNLIADWLDLKMTNFGMLLKEEKEAGNDKRFVGYFYSDEYADPAFRPKLTVTYHMP